MKILLTGGSGDVGTLLSIDLIKQGHQVINVDVAPPKVSDVTFIQGSIIDRQKTAEAMAGVDCVIHIAAWHGIHEKTKTPADFHDLNVTGTFNTLQAAVDADVKKFIFISSTSVSDATGLYGNTKILGEEMLRAYADRHPEMTFMTLRPRAFVPSWNKAVYNTFPDWANWFVKGAVHIDDFKNAILVAIQHQPNEPAATYVIDGAYDYTQDELENWSEATFAARCPDDVDIAKQHGIDTARKPKVLDIPDNQRLPGYAPSYSLKNLLQDLRRFGAEGPPSPFEPQQAQSRSATSNKDRHP